VNGNSLQVLLDNFHGKIFIYGDLYIIKKEWGLILLESYPEKNWKHLLLFSRISPHPATLILEIFASIGNV